MMQIFNATIRLAGEMANEVGKRGLTVPEIYVLRRLHGNSSVVKLVHVGFAEIDPLDERERLDYEYGAGLMNLHEEQKTSVEKMFGADFSPLPEELRDYEGELVDEENELEEFRKSLPYASPNAEDRATTIRRKAAEKAAAKAAKAKKDILPVRTGKKADKTALEAIM